MSCRLYHDRRHRGHTTNALFEAAVLLAEAKLILLRERPRFAHRRAWLLVERLAACLSRMIRAVEYLERLSNGGREEIAEAESASSEIKAVA